MKIENVFEDPHGTMLLFDYDTIHYHINKGIDLNNIIYVKEKEINESKLAMVFLKNHYTIIGMEE